MNQESVSFSRFGKDFQEKLAQLILQDRVFSDQIHEVLDTNFLELKYLQIFVEKVFSYNPPRWTWFGERDNQTADKKLFCSHL